MDSRHELLVRRLANGESLPGSADLEQVLLDIGLSFSRASGSVRLDSPLELLDQDRILQSLAPATRAAISRLSLFFQIDSTNTFLLQTANDPGFHGSVCLAEQQLAGKGRRGRHWVSPFGSNIYLSAGWSFPAGVAGISGLSLVTGMAVVNVLRDAGYPDVGLKWPNDVLLHDGKLAGILVEIAPVRRGLLNVVIGIGVNLRLEQQHRAGIGQAASSLAEASPVSRNALIGQLLNGLQARLAEFSQAGFALFAERWRRYDLYRDQLVDVTSVDQVNTGINRGVDPEGNLLLEVSGRISAFSAGEVSLRKRNDA